MTAVRELLTRRGDIELKFIRHRVSGTVHVVVPDDPDKQGEVFRIGEVPADAQLAMASGQTPTLCGYLAYKSMDGTRRSSDEMVSEFDDAHLCARCWRALGPEHQARAFEYHQPSTMLRSGT
ncbi:hypothetical protein [Kutzneria buriramensis]|uniref:Uncharacterized protein n=1 Tax=Kutzneria buriramensis TaxID=1045776 RepID=A0A3E0HLI8_9PSEU|nr:hypothetical protein [Kutzneria buriramensis]REH47319.1 hypothetical protein BCF44_106484 [Kutzneria buriramensis]